MYHWNFLILWVIKSNIRWHLCFCYFYHMLFFDRDKCLCDEMRTWFKEQIHLQRGFYMETSLSFPKMNFTIYLYIYITLNFMLYFSYLVPLKVRNAVTKMKGPYKSLNVDFNIQNKTMLLVIWLNGSVLNCKCI